MIVKYKKHIFRLLVLVVSFFVASGKYCSAASLMYKVDCAQSGKTCGLKDFFQVVVNLSDWILGITGSLALLAFVYGGVMFLISGGNNEAVAKGKRILIGAVIGLAIVFLSYMIINFIMEGLEADSNWSTTN